MAVCIYGHFCAIRTLWKCEEIHCTCTAIVIVATKLCIDPLHWICSMMVYFISLPYIMCNLGIRKVIAYEVLSEANLVRIPLCLELLIFVFDFLCERCYVIGCTQFVDNIRNAAFPSKADANCVYPAPLTPWASCTTDSRGRGDTSGVYYWYWRGKTQVTF